MELIKCKYCSGIELVLKEKRPHIGAYCKKCGRWLKWLSKKDLLNEVTENTIVNEVTENIIQRKDKTDEEVPW